MPTSFTDQFFTFDPADPPPVGTIVTTEQHTLTDQNDDGDIDEFDDDAVAGIDVTATWPGDTVTIAVPGEGNVTYTGTTVYISDGTIIFTPTDGQVLSAGEFVSSTYVTVQGPLMTNQLGPPCFLPGTDILTPAGERKVEDLKPGDLVETLDRGPIPLVHIRCRELSRCDLKRNPRHAPIRVPASAFQKDLSGRDLLVSPQHRMLLRSKIVLRMFGVEEVLAPAAQLVGFQGIERIQVADPIKYLHLLFDHHAIVTSNGVASESLYLSTNSLAELKRTDFLAIQNSMTASEIYSMRPARKFAFGRKLRQLLDRHRKNGKCLFEVESPKKTDAA